MPQQLCFPQAAVLYFQGEIHSKAISSLKEMVRAFNRNRDHKIAEIRQEAISKLVEELLRCTHPVLKRKYFNPLRED